jgi:hypothetical protein
MSPGIQWQPCSSGYPWTESELLRSSAMHAAARRVYQSVFRALHRDIADTMPGFNDPGFGDRLAEEITALKGRELPGFLNLQVW